MTRQEHLQWCKDRAMQYVDRGDITNAFASMISDLRKHPETKDHVGIQMGMMLQNGGHMSTEKDVREFIDGFN